MFYSRLHHSLQLLVVTTAHWDSAQGELMLFERSSLEESWKRRASVIPVVVGKKGMAWDCDGMVSLLPGPVKREGDCRSPAGLFAVGPLFGEESHRLHAQKMDFISLTPDLVCVDDPASRHYNRFVSTDTVAERDWGSCEQMKSYLPLYAIGGVIQYNTNPSIAGRGSCIFMHIASSLDSGTAGCTAMEEEQMCFVASWLDQKKSPMLLQLPREILAQLPERSLLANADAINRSFAQGESSL